jgi:enamine deaminase RidA (YjgF/YER057c/UK114 family)
MSYDAKFRAIAQTEGVPEPDGGELANYIPWRRVGDTLYLSGAGPLKNGEVVSTGRLGATLTVQEGAAAARLTGLNLLWTVREALGTLDQVQCIVAVDGMVNCVAGFESQSAVLDGCSNLLVEIFGDAGRHTRSAVGQVALAFDVSVEIKMIVLAVASPAKS